MPDVLTLDQRHRNMAAIHSSSTKPELRLRHALWRQGFRYRINDKRLPGSPDIVLPKFRTVIFVHGCFWHGHKDCTNYSVPKTNTEYWKAKVTRNHERDQEVWRRLESKGWNVIIVWECQLKKASLGETLEAVSAEIRQNGKAFLRAEEERRASQKEYLHNLKARKNREKTLFAEIKSNVDHKRILSNEDSNSNAQRHLEDLRF